MSTWCLHACSLLLLYQPAAKYTAASSSSSSSSWLSAVLRRYTDWRGLLVSRVDGGLGLGLAADLIGVVVNLPLSTTHTHTHTHTHVADVIGRQSSRTVQNIRLSTDILWRVCHVLTEPVSSIYGYKRILNRLRQNMENSPQNIRRYTADTFIVHGGCCFDGRHLTGRQRGPTRKRRIANGIKL